MWLTTSEYKVGIITTACSIKNCNIDDRIDVTKSNSLSKVQTNLAGEDFLLYNNRQLIKNGFTGTQYTDQFTFNFNGTDSTTVNTRFLGVHNPTNPFKSAASGFVGLMPYTALDETQKKDSFIYDLISEGAIDNPIISVFINEKGKKKSSIKFGGLFDSRAIIAESAAFFKTQSLNTWMLKTDWSVRGTGDSKTDIVKGSVTRNLLIDPQLTYLYLPDNDFKMLNSIDSKIQCNFNINFCKYLDKCENVNKLNFLLNLNIKGDKYDKDFHLNIEDLFVPGKTMGLNDDSCYMKVFRSF